MTTLMQEIWNHGFQLDQLLPTDLKEYWEGIAKGLTLSTHTQLPRQYFPSSSKWPEDTELHVFVDASTKAYGAVAYVKSSTADLSSFVMAKSRVAPLKRLTLPQLELTAASIGTRLYSYLERILPVTKVFFWSDSQIVLHWLYSTKQLKPYVANRVAEIKTLTTNDNWRYYPTDDNPADLLTRGITASQLIASQIWRSGPTWLLENPKAWPSWKSTTHLLLSQTGDLTKEEKAPIPPDDPCNQHELHHLIQVSDFGSLSRLVDVVAYLLRFVNNCQNKNPKQTGPLTPTQRDEVTLQLIHNAQQLAYHDEIKNLTSKGVHE